LASNDLLRDQLLHDSPPNFDKRQLLFKKR